MLRSLSKPGLFFSEGIYAPIQITWRQVKNKMDRVNSRVKSRVDKKFTGAETNDRWANEDEAIEALGQKKSINFETNSSMKALHRKKTGPPSAVGGDFEMETYTKKSACSLQYANRKDMSLILQAQRSRLQLQQAALARMLQMLQGVMTPRHLTRRRGYLPDPLQRKRSPVS